WALLLLDECNLHPNAVVLDVATGPGTVARLAAKRIGSGGRVVATDISRPMLDVANSKPSSPDSAPITYIESPAAPLGVESAASILWCANRVCSSFLTDWPLSARCAVRSSLGDNWRSPHGPVSRTTPCMRPSTRRSARAFPAIYRTGYW